MALLSKLFSKKKELNAASARIDEQVYLLNYREHYASILQEHSSPKVLSELFLFRAWTAQFGFRIFSSDASSSEKLIGETVNSSKHLGLGVFQWIHGFSVEKTLGSDFISLIEDRWRQLDLVVSTEQFASGLPTMKIIDVLTRRLHIVDPTVTYQLSVEFLVQLDFIKRTALEIGLLH